MKLSPKIIAFDAEESIKAADLSSVTAILNSLQNIDEETQIALVKELRKGGIPVAAPLVGRMLKRGEFEKIFSWLNPSAKTKEDRDFLAQAARIGFDKSLALLGQAIEKKDILFDLMQIASKIVLLTEGRDQSEEIEQIINALNTKIGERLTHALEEEEIVGFTMDKWIRSLEKQGTLVAFLKLAKGDLLERVLRARQDSVFTYGLSFLDALNEAGKLDRFFDMERDLNKLGRLFHPAVGNAGHVDGFMNKVIGGSPPLSETDPACISMLQKLFAIAEKNDCFDEALTAAVGNSSQGVQLRRIILAMGTDFSRFFNVVGLGDAPVLRNLIGKLLEEFKGRRRSEPLPGARNEALAGLITLFIGAKKTENMDLLLSAAKKEGVLEDLLDKTKLMKKKRGSEVTMFNEVQILAADGKLSDEIAGEILLFS
ncbi:MAG: hypothetical protein HQ564_00555 [Candidatus Saganbacteria bacterium]|nr:hypothetical protein [Candidatus Saganbacteria bacterium]